MKPHLPKMLLTAVMAVAAMSAQGAIQGTTTTTSATIAGKEYTDDIIVEFGTPADTDPIQPSAPAAGKTIDYTLFTCNKSDGSKESNGGRYKINGDSTAYLNPFGTLIVASGTYNAGTDNPAKAFKGGQLFISNWRYNGVTTINNKILIGETDYSERDWETAIRLSATDSIHKRVVFTGGITAIQDASIAVDGNYTYVEGAFNGDAGTTLTLTKSGALHLSGGGTLDTLNMGSATVTLDNTKSDGTAITDAGQLTYSIGTLIGNKMSLSAGTSLTLRSRLKGTVTNLGAMSINDNAVIDIAGLSTTTVYKTRDTDGLAQTGTGYHVISGNAASFTNVTLVNGNTTLSGYSFDGSNVYADDTAWQDSDRYVLVEQSNYTTQALSSVTSAAELSISAGKTLEVNNTQWALDKIYGTGNILLTTNATVDDAGGAAKSTNVTGTLTIQGTAAQHTVLNHGFDGQVDSGEDSKANSVASFSKIVLDNADIHFCNAATTYHNLTTTEGSANNFFAHDMNNSTTIFADTTTLAEGSTLAIGNHWNAQFEFEKVSGSGTLEIRALTGADTSAFKDSGGSNGAASYTINITNDQFTGSVIANNSNASVTIALEKDGILKSTQLTKTAASALNLKGLGTYIIGATNTQAGPVVTFADGWTGTAVLDTVGIKGQLGNCGRAGSTIELTNVNGWVTTSTVAADVKMNAGTALQFVDGNSKNTLTFSGKVSGTGNMLFNATLPSGMAGDGGGRGATAYGVKFTGNLSEWTGAIVANDTAKNAISAEFAQGTDSTIAVGLTAQNNSKLNLITSGNGTKTFTGTLNVNTITIGAPELIAGTETMGTAQTVLKGNVTTAGVVTLTEGASLVLGCNDNNSDNVSAPTELNLHSLTINSGAQVKLNYAKGSLGDVNLAGGTLFYRDSKTQASDSISIGRLTISENSSLTKNWKGNLNVDVLTGSGDLAISNNGNHTASDTIHLNISSVTNYTGTMSSTANKFTTTIAAADQEGSRSGTIAQNVTLADGFTKSGTGTLNLTGTTTAAGSVTMAGGTLNLAKADTTISSLTLHAGTTLTLGEANGDHNATLTTSNLTVTGTATINADLVVSGGTMSFADGMTLTMGCSVTIGKGDLVTVELTEEMVDIIASGGRVDLFTSVETATLGNHIVFTGANGAELDHAEVYSLQYDGSKIYVTPEPATATLSLLALSALAARRRRH